MHVRGKSGAEFSADLTVFQDSGLGGKATCKVLPSYSRTAELLELQAV